MRNRVELQSLEGEREIPSVNSEAPAKIQRGLAIFVLTIFFIILTSCVYLKSQSKDEKNNKQMQTEASNDRITSTVPSRTFPDKPIPTKQALSTHPDNATLPNQTTLPTLSTDTPLIDKSASSLMASSGGSGTRGDALSQPHEMSTTNPNATGINSNNTNAFTGNDNPADLSAHLTASHTPMQRAAHLGNRNFILAKGSFIDCALQTKLDSTVPGMTACVVTRNLYSDNGKVLLIERGTLVTGEYQSNLRQGMARIFVLWNRIKTPNGIVIDLDSPSTDPLGGSGLPGYIDTHFWQRFGGALMLSLVDDTARALTTNMGTNSGGQQNFNFSSTSDAAQNMATEALKNTINIPPTLYKNQGDEIGIYVARDLNFESVYDVKATR